MCRSWWLTRSGKPSCVENEFKVASVSTCVNGCSIPGNKTLEKEEIKGSKSLDLLSFACLGDRGVEILCWIFRSGAQNSWVISTKIVHEAMVVGCKQKPVSGCTCETKSSSNILMVLAFMVVSLWEDLFAKSPLYWMSEYSQWPTGDLNVPTCDPPIRVTLDILATLSWLSSVFGFPWCITWVFPNNWTGYEEGVRGWWQSPNPAASGCNFFLKLLDLCSDHSYSVLHGGRGHIAQEINEEHRANGNALNWTGIDLGIVPWTFWYHCIFVSIWINSCKKLCICFWLFFFSFFYLKYFLNWHIYCKKVQCRRIYMENTSPFSSPTPPPFFPFLNWFNWLSC